MKSRVAALLVLAFWIVTPIAAAECFRACPTEAAAADHCNQPSRDSAAVLKSSHDCSTHTVDPVPATAGLRFDLNLGPAPDAPAGLRSESMRLTAVDALAFRDVSPPAGFLVPLRQ